MSRRVFVCWLLKTKSSLLKLWQYFTCSSLIRTKDSPLKTVDRALFLAFWGIFTVLMIRFYLISLNADVLPCPVPHLMLSCTRLIEGEWRAERGVCCILMDLPAKLASRCLPSPSPWWLSKSASDHQMQMADHWFGSQPPFELHCLLVVYESSPHPVNTSTTLLGRQSPVQRCWETSLPIDSIHPVVQKGCPLDITQSLEPVKNDHLMKWR